MVMDKLNRVRYALKTFNSKNNYEFEKNIILKV